MNETATANKKIIIKPQLWPVSGSKCIINPEYRNKKANKHNTAMTILNAVAHKIKITVFTFLFIFLSHAGFAGLFFTNKTVT
ncbi:MAG: hypothetical protein LBI12_04180, partial [Treponema sp.]|nr:hypothetical protein [Treponema sp.]